MISVIARLNDIADKLDEQGRSDLSDSLDKIASVIVEAYVPRFHRPRRQRGRTRIHRKRYYRLHMPNIRRRQRIYRMKHRTQLKRRRRLRHYRRYG